jgi:hypothetical protein
LGEVTTDRKSSDSDTLTWLKLVNKRCAECEHVISPGHGKARSCEKSGRPGDRCEIIDIICCPIGVTADWDKDGPQLMRGARQMLLGIERKQRLGGGN